MGNLYATIYKALGIDWRKELHEPHRPPVKDRELPGSPHRRASRRVAGINRSPAIHESIRHNANGIKTPASAVVIRPTIGTYMLPLRQCESSRFWSIWIRPAALHLLDGSTT